MARDRSAPCTSAGPEEADQRTYSSPPCYACETDPDYLFARPMDGPELLGFLCLLLDAERELAAGLDETSGAVAPEMRAATAFGQRELARQVERLGGTRRSEVKLGTAGRAEGEAAAVARQRALLEEIKRAVPLIADPKVVAALTRVQAAHERALAAIAAPDEALTPAAAARCRAPRT